MRGEWNYAMLSQKAAMAGGPDKLLSNTFSAGVGQGIMIGCATTVSAFSLGIGIWKFIQYRRDLKALKQIESESDV